MSQENESSEFESSSAAASRRKFLMGGGMMLAGGAIVGSNLKVAKAAHAFGSDTIRIGLIGCGSRGTAAAIQALNTHCGPSESESPSQHESNRGSVELVAMADVFQNNLQASYRALRGRHGKKVRVEDSQFVGLDAYQRVMESDADVVLLTTPPGFRPQHFEAAVDAGKHVFMEKPVATDAPGVRRVLAANARAKELGLGVHVGLQRHHEFRYRECIERLQDGMIGKLMFARVYWNGGNAWVRQRGNDQTELEYQLRNWYHFNWLSGDHLVEQHIHNLDVINWLMQSHPIEAQGQGGRTCDDGINHGQVFDHHMVEFTYAGGFKLFSQCRHIQGCWNNVSEHVHGTDGTSTINEALIRDAHGKKRWQSEAQEARGKGWQQQHQNFFAALRAGDVPNEADYGAYSTMTAILGRLASYSGKRVKWKDAFESDVQLADTDSLNSLADHAPVQLGDAGSYPIPKPGSGERYV